MPLLQQASNADRAQGLTVLAVDYEETNGGSIRSFLDKLGVHVAALYDPAGQIAAEYGVNVGLPVSVFIDRSGKVSYIQVGQMSNQVLEQHLQPIL
jgi:peroxiredoxin